VLKAFPNRVDKTGWKKYYIMIFDLVFPHKRLLEGKFQFKKS